MKEISINGCDLSTMCRLCLSTGGTVMNIFSYSDKMRNQLADVIMKCAPVQIIKRDEMPKHICQLCYTQLGNTHQFQMQILQSEKALRKYMKKLQTSSTQIKPEYSIEEPSEDFLIHKTNADVTVKSESLEEYGMLDMAPTNCNFTEINVKEERDDEPIDDNSLNITKSPLSQDYGCDINCDDTKSGSGHIIKSEIEDLPKDDNNSLILTESPADTLKTLSNDGSEISCEDKQIGGSSNFTRLSFTGGIENVGKDKHKRIHTEKKSYQCDTCKKCFSRIGNLNVHKQLHTGEKPYQCTDCKKFFSSLSALNVHKRTHTGETPYQCDICNKCFSHLGNFNVHKQLHTGEKPYQCAVCKKFFSSLSALNVHKRTHTGETPYQCDICNKCFSQSITLNRHKRTHTGEKPYQCDICNKSFSLVGNLNVHKQLHTGEKPYQCAICKKFFSSSSALKLHKRTHTGEKPYQCDICNTCFSQSITLNRHKRTHTGEKPYRCDICNKSFALVGNLNVHKQVHTGENPYQCDN